MYYFFSMPCLRNVLIRIMSCMEVRAFEGVGKLFQFSKSVPQCSWKVLYFEITFGLKDMIVLISNFTKLWQLKEKKYVKFNIFFKICTYFWKYINPNKIKIACADKIAYPSNMKFRCFIVLSIYQTKKYTMYLLYIYDYDQEKYWNPWEHIE